MSSEGVNPHPLSEENQFLLQEPAQPALVSLGKEAERNYSPFATSFSQREWSGNTTSICPFLDTSLVLSAVQDQPLGLKQFLSKGFTVLSTLCPSPYEVLCICIHAFFFLVPCEIGRVNIWVCLSSLQELGYFSLSRDNNIINSSSVHPCLLLLSLFGKCVHLVGFIVIWGLLMPSPWLKIKIPVVRLSWLATSPISWCQTDPTNLTSISQVSMDTWVEHWQ